MRAAIIAALVLVGSLAGVLTAPTASAGSAYKKDAQRVAERMGCHKTGGEIAAPFTYDAATCTLRGREFSVMTFRGPRPQRRWLRIALSYDGFCLATKRGVVVEPDSGSRRDARLAAVRLHGRVRCG